MARPTNYPLWATQDEIDPEVGTPNKEVPSVEKQNFGQRANKNTLRQDINYLFDKIREWIQFFDEQYDIGDVYWLVDSGQTFGPSGATIELAISEQLGGKWELIDGGASDPTDTVAGQVVYIFKKISEVNQ